MAIKHIVKTSVGEKLGAWKQIMSLMQHDLPCRSILRAPPATTHVPDLLTKATAGARSARRASTNFIVSDCFHVLARVTVFTTSVLTYCFSVAKVALAGYFLDFVVSTRNPFQ